MSTQSTNLARVRSVLGDMVKDFCSTRINQNFHASELATWCTDRLTRVAPGSPDRILRDLRQRGEVDYEVVSRAGSVYYVKGVSA